MNSQTERPHNSTVSEATAGEFSAALAEQTAHVPEKPINREPVAVSKPRTLEDEIVLIGKDLPHLAQLLRDVVALRRKYSL